MPRDRGLGTSSRPGPGPRIRADRKSSTSPSRRARWRGSSLARTSRPGRWVELASGFSSTQALLVALGEFLVHLDDLRAEALPVGSHGRQRVGLLLVVDDHVVADVAARGQADPED